MFVIAEITLQHQFYPDSVWRDATLVPDQNTHELMRRLGLSLVAAGNIWRIYGYAPTGRTAFLQYCVSQDARNPLRFWLVQPNAWLLAVTALPGEWKGVLGFSSERITADGQRPGAMIMGAAQAQSAPASVRNGDVDGQNGWVIRSTSTITLQQAPTQRFALMDIPRTQTQSGRTRQQTVMSVLPTPAADRLFTAYSADQQPVSVMYVYV